MLLQEPYNLGATPSLKQKVYEQLLMRIITGELPPCEKLHEEELAVEMGISRAPLREALNMLERDGFIEIIPRKGAVVSSVSEDDIKNLWEIRELLEPFAAVASMPNIPEVKLVSVRESLEAVHQNPKDFEAYVDSDILVHALFGDYLKNHYLRDILKNLKDHSLRMRWNAEKRHNEIFVDLIVTSTQEHIAIVEALLARDAALVHQTTLSHLQNSQIRTNYQFTAKQNT